VPYSVDTSALLDAWVRNYPADVFPGIWEQMNRAAQDGILFVCDEVVNELSKKDDGAHGWVKARNGLVVPLDSEIESHVQEIMKKYPRLVDTKKGRSVGDPFVIALARAKGYTVITGENATGKIDVPKIPDVCDDLKIPWVRMLGFFREQKWML
jgi:Domain of unknown function (DUF4411)